MSNEAKLNCELDDEDLAQAAGGEQLNVNDAVYYNEQKVTILAFGTRTAGAGGRCPSTYTACQIRYNDGRTEWVRASLLSKGGYTFTDDGGGGAVGEW